MDVEALRKKLAGIQEQLSAMVVEGDKDTAYWTAEREAEFDALHKDAAATEASIRRHMSVGDLRGRMASPVPTESKPSDPSVARAASGDPAGGFRSMGENLQAIVQSDRRSGIVDSRIMAAAPSTFGATDPGSDGGFMVAPEFSPEIRENLFTDDNLMPLTNITPVQGNSMTFPADESTPWGTSGIQAYVVEEGATITQSKPTGKTHTVNLIKLAVLVPLTQELIADASAMAAFVFRKAMKAMTYKINDLIVNGAGGALPLGVFKSGRFVSQAKEGSQVADTIVPGNIGKMWGRLLNTASPSVRWLMNPDAFHQLPLMTVGNTPVWMPPNGLQSAPNGSLYGKPIVLTPVTQTLGDQGDLFLWDGAGYEVLMKTTGFESDVSMDFFFDSYSMALRVIFRFNGMPALTAPVTPPNSAVTQSDTITLDARA